MSNSWFDERSTASKIKDRVNRLSVENALVILITKLKTYKVLPKTGLILFASEKIIEIIPPIPLKHKIYVCGRKFVTEHLEELYTAHQGHSIGFIIVDGSEIVLCIQYGTVQDVVYRKKVELPKNHNQGGQSQNRFLRLREEAYLHYYKIICDNINEYFIVDGLCFLDGVVIAGMAQVKDKLLESVTFPFSVKQKIINTGGVITTQSRGLQGLQEIIEKCDISTKLIQKKDDKILSEIFKSFDTDDQKIIYGQIEISKFLSKSLVKKIIINVDAFTTNQLEKLYEKCIEHNCCLIVVYDKTSLSKKFQQFFGGIVGILYYSTQYSATN